MKPKNFILALNPAANKKLFYDLAIFAGLLATAVFAPLFRNQFISGSLVNAALFAAAVFLGEKALFLAFFSSPVALLIGLLPPQLAVMVPFIMAGNAFLITVFLKAKGPYFLKAGLAVLAKSLFLFTASYFVLKIGGLIPSGIWAMMAWPQAVTASLGAFFAYFLTLKKNG